MKNPLARLLARPTRSEELRQLGVRADLVRAVERTAFGRQTDRDLLALDAVLDDDEAVLRLLEGRAGRSVGLLALTSRRLVFLPRGAGDVVEVPLTAVRAATSATHRGMGRLTVERDGDAFVVDQILGIQAGWMCDDITAAGRAPADAPAPVRDPLEELAELRALHAGGLVDDSEYDARKRELFGRL
ncbi:SHOCT domain-containing protein [Nakamurella deserti]|uniref:SHOCT domain-containing protein n=1 Tax=Nakamurella deserti TaxID=2164074 RepID=UPI000DBE69E3|nr:SHOCT domain-containing protein [Nakamurella deserti]